ncbi:MAG: MFS transporter [Proteobacteria bacterium]|nr:MFS transporter [Pseudomonadota bacterium]
MDNAFSKAAWRLFPFLGILYVACFLDRVNVGFAALTMNKDLSISDTAFGIAGGIFFIGYFFFEVPSNVILARVGARAWICRIMITWGLVSMAMAFAQGEYSIYGLRFLLGVAEAGFFPGIVYYLTHWFPAAMRGRFMAMFLAAIALANVVGSPVSGLLLNLEGFYGLHGWQWLFLIEGLPAVILGFCVLAWLPDAPEKASWLSREEKQAIKARLAEDPPGDHSALWPMLKDVRVWLLAIPDFGIVLALYGVGLWLPQIVKGLGFSIFQTGLVVAVPYVLSVVAMLVWGASSDRSGERFRHTSLAAGIAAIALFAAALLGTSLWSVIALCVATMGIYASITVFWTLPPSFLSGTAAAGGIALINSIANLGGFFGPYLMGWFKTATGGYSAGFAVLALGLIMTAVVILALSGPLARRAAQPAS